MMKMIMPMASPAAVSVSHVLGEPIKGSTSSASPGTSASGFQSKSREFMVHPSNSIRCSVFCSCLRFMNKR